MCISVTYPPCVWRGWLLDSRIQFLQGWEAFKGPSCNIFVVVVIYSPYNIDGMPVGYCCLWSTFLCFFLLQLRDMEHKCVLQLLDVRFTQWGENRSQFCVEPHLNPNWTSWLSIWLCYYYCWHNINSDPWQCSVGLSFIYIIFLTFSMNDGIFCRVLLVA